MADEWGIERDGTTVSLLGPGWCDIHLFNFDASKIKTAEGEVEDAPTSKYLFMHWIFRSWEYPMSGDTELCLYSQRDEANPESLWRHYLGVKDLHSQWKIEWTVPGDFAEELYGFFGATEKFWALAYPGDENEACSCRALHEHASFSSPISQPHRGAGGACGACGIFCPVVGHSTPRAQPPA